LYVPQELPFALFCRRGVVEDASRTWTSGRLPAGEYSLTAAIHAGSEGKWSLRLEYAGRVVTVNDLEEASPRPPDSQPYIIQGCVGTTVVLGAEPGERADLLAEIEPEAHLFGGTAENRGPGLRLWLEPLGP
jgi:hypothetical protein